ncbi:hypothetical protein Ef18B226LT_09250 [Escherichia fergusonii]|nr:hypothetical protein Ef30038_10440 [Escherichia fergusonii]BES12346.1 hypothetical protein Ef18B226LT_09250 [Escherichia fergusonii]
MLQKVTHNHILATPKQALLTDDRQRVLRFAAEALTAGMAAALVTLVEVRGGAARRPGAQMAVREDGAYWALSPAAAWKRLPLMKHWKRSPVVMTARLFTE